MLAESMEVKRRDEQPAKTLSVLVIEDCESDVVLVENMLHDVSPDVYLSIVDVPRLAEAFKLIDRQDFDVVLLDLNLLDIQGVGSVAALHAEIPETPIIVYSGMNDPKIHKESLQCGAQYYCVKGNETGYSLKHVIEEVLSKQP